MKTTTSLITRELFSLSTMLLIVLPLLMHTPAGGTSMLDKAEHSLSQFAGDLTVDSFTNLISRKANSFSFAGSAAFSQKSGYSLTANSGPIFLNYSY